MSLSSESLSVSTVCREHQNTQTSWSAFTNPPFKCYSCLLPSYWLCSTTKMHWIHCSTSLCPAKLLLSLLCIKLKNITFKISSGKVSPCWVWRQPEHAKQVPIHSSHCLWALLSLTFSSLIRYICAGKKKKKICFLSLLSFGFKETKENTTVCLALWYRWHSFSHSAKSVSKLTWDLLKWSCDHWNEQQRKPQEQALILHVFCCCCCGFCFVFAF